EINSENELSWLSEIESNDDESNAIAENLAQTDIDLIDKDESELGEETENDELVDSDIFWEETKQNNPTTTANYLIEKSVQDLEEILQQTVEPLLAELKEPPNDNLETITDIETIKDAETDVELHLSLTEEIFVRNQLGNLAIAGSIDTVEETAAASSFTLTGKLIFQLRDPQSNEILLEKERALVEKSLPFSFSDRLEIPPECQTRLILGEVILQSSSGVILASQIFTVTADVQELLKIFNQENSDRATEKQMQLVESSLPKQKKAVALREDFIQLAKKSEQVKSTKRSSGQIIPPKIGRSIAEEKTFKSLRLPNFGKPLALKVNTDPDTETSVVLNLEQLQDSVHQAIGKTNGNGNNKIADSTAVEDNSEKSLEISLTKDIKDDNEEKQEIVSDAIAHAEATSEFDSTDSEQPEIVEPVSQTSSENQEVTDSNNLKNELDEENLFDFSSQPEAKSSEIVAENDESSGDESFNENIFAEDLTDFPAEEISNETSSENSANEDNTDLWFSDESRNVEDEFKALKMQERFFSRLNSLATDIEGRELLPSDSPEEDNEPAEEELASSVETEIEDFTLDFASDIPDTEQQEEINSDQQKIEEEIINLTEETPELATEEIEAEISSEEPPNDVVIDETTDEIVIETEDETDLRNNTTAVDTSGLPYPAEVTQIPPKSAIFSQPQWKGEVPTPQLSISETELIPGEPMRVRVKLSSYPGSVYVKLWIKDRQTRTLLDGPHALVDLIPNRFGELETISQMKVPLGSMEISIEAIAISPETQRESHKAILNHVVLPPDELDFSFDDF
ncbi:MAG: hypothetical protein SAL07_22110, partial [Oscillatoria sp. PMC 1051.18]|nr:hypothetical protein [Oscillatoria sp. PMC 1050.18]MEC5032604.1 hypothetical protein [Oscillatoria sp. PMC 1051.18]